MSNSEVAFGTAWLRIMATTCMLGAAGFAKADYAGPSWLEVTEQVGTPEGYRTFRLILHFTDPEDKLFTVGSGSVNGTPFDLEIDFVGGIFNGDGKLAGDHLAALIPVSSYGTPG